MALKNKYALFEAFGVELEYMIVDRDNLKVRPIADQLLYDFSGNYSGNFENGLIDWSNELVSHVIELKVHQPVSDLTGLEEAFSKNIRLINGYLQKHNALLLPGSMHPTFDPLKETVLWPHENSEIYKLYNKVFDCRGHGWSNLQSVHLNLPFANEDEFARLHAAIRVVLPLIPGLAASSPILDGKLFGYQDSRMWFYLNNQKQVPSLMGKLIPEPVYSKEDYYDKIFQPIIKDFKDFDPDGLMQPYFLNSRGAIARFDRQAIEIRVMDIQECPTSDLCIIRMIVALLKYLCFSDKQTMEAIKKTDTDRLSRLFKKAIQYGEDCLIEDKKYLSLFGCKEYPINIKGLWSKLLDTKLSLSMKERSEAQYLLTAGTLSSRIIKQYETWKEIDSIYKSLATCLETNTYFS